MPQNNHIFGPLNRATVDKERVTYPAKLIHQGRRVLNGTAIVLSVDNTTVKVQLVAGNAEFNFLTTDCYIDELDLGRELIYTEPDSYFQFANAKKALMFPSSDSADGVYLPVAYSDENTNKFNRYQWGLTSFKVSSGHEMLLNTVQPYLVAVMRRLMEAFDYQLDYNYIAQTWMKNIYIVNANRENTWIAKALPHWTVGEFIDEIEKLFGVIFVADQDSNSVSFVDINSYFDEDIYVLDRIVDSYVVDISEESLDKDVSIGNVCYDLPSNTDGGYERLDNNIKENAKAVTYPSYTDMTNAWNAMNNADKAANIFVFAGRYYINFKDENNNNKLRNVNLYGDLVRDPESDDYSSLKIVPAKINQEEFSIWDTPSVTGNKVASIKLNVPFANDAMSYKDSGKQINIQNVIEGEDSIYEKPVKKFMEIAIFTGDLIPIEIPGQNVTLDFPNPFIDYNQLSDSQKIGNPPYSLCLYDQNENAIGHRIMQQRKINSNIEYTFYFQHYQVPPINRMFLIYNQKCFAKQIKVTFKSKGAEPVYEGVFYKID